MKVDVNPAPKSGAWVKKVAKLANLSIKEEDESKFEKQLVEILGYVEKLQEVDTTGVKITSQVTGLENVTRDDKASESLSQNVAVSQAKDTQNGMFKVPAILEE